MDKYKREWMNFIPHNVLPFAMWIVAHQNLYFVFLIYCLSSVFCLWVLENYILFGSLSPTCCASDPSGHTPGWIFKKSRLMYCLQIWKLIRICHERLFITSRTSHLTDFFFLIKTPHFSFSSSRDCLQFALLYMFDNAPTSSYFIGLLYIFTWSH